MNDENQLNENVQQDDEERHVWQRDKLVAFNVDFLDVSVENMIESV